MKTLDFNRDWLFALNENDNAYLPDYKDSHWQNLHVPHDWSMNLGYNKVEGNGATGYVLGGIGWYRKHFDMDVSALKGTNYILFDGVYNRAELWINGQKLGSHAYGYSPFYFDLSPLLKEGDNVIALKVDRRRFVDSRWYSGSGIYRKVEFLQGPLIHVPPWGSFVHCEEVSGKSALVKSSHTIVNRMSEDCRVKGITEILSPDGLVLKNSEKEIVIKAGQQKTLESEDLLRSPALWDCKHPNLYTLKYTIRYKDKAIDSTITPFGIRAFRFNAAKGFSLNGISMKIKGVCLHHDAGLCGSAVPKDVWERRLTKLKAMGCNAIRMAHNPSSNDLLDLCDEMGFLVQDEFFDEWDYPKDKRQNMGEKHDDFISRGSSEYFREDGESDLKSTILSHRNHPCIIQWSIGNEIEWTYPRNVEATGFFSANADGNYFWNTPPHSVDEIRNQLKTLPREDYDIGKTAKKLAAWTRETDPTRPVTANCILPSVSFESAYTDALDIVGFSYRRVIYDYARQHYPGKAVMGAENLGQWHEWKAVMERDSISGTFIWTGIDYLGEAHKKGENHKGTPSGFLDLAGFEKPSYHMYKSLWNDEAHIKLFCQKESESPFWLEGNEVVEREKGAWEKRLWAWHGVDEHWNYEEGQRIIIEAYSNCPEAELFLNGTSLGRKTLSDFPDHIYKWSSPYSPGKLSIKGWKNETEIEDNMITAGPPCSIDLKLDTTTLKAASEDCLHVEAQLIDNNRQPVKHQGAELSFEVNGACRILGVDNGSVENWTNHSERTVMTNRGRALMILQAADSPGSVEVSVSFLSTTGQEKTSKTFHIK